MSWVTVIWSMNASACLTLAVIYFLVWHRNRTVVDPPVVFRDGRINGRLRVL